MTYLALALAIMWPSGLEVPRSGAATARQVLPQHEITLTAAQRWQIADVLAGECSPATMGSDAAAAVAWTIRNRLQAGQTLTKALSAYFAREHATDQELEIVLEVFAAPQWDDPTGGAQWALSREDRHRWHFPPGDVVYRGHGGLELHVYRRSPWRP